MAGGKEFCRWAGHMGSQVEVPELPKLPPREQVDRGQALMQMLLDPALVSANAPSQPDTAPATLEGSGFDGFEAGNALLQMLGHGSSPTAASQQSRESPLGQQSRESPSHGGQQYPSRESPLWNRALPKQEPPLYSANSEFASGTQPAYMDSGFSKPSQPSQGWYPIAPGPRSVGAQPVEPRRAPPPPQQRRGTSGKGGEWSDNAGYVADSHPHSNSTFQQGYTAAQVHSQAHSASSTFPQRQRQQRDTGGMQRRPNAPAYWDAPSPNILPVPKLGRSKESPTSTKNSAAEWLGGLEGESTPSTAVADADCVDSSGCEEETQYAGYAQFTEGSILLDGNGATMHKRQDGHASRGGQIAMLAALNSRTSQTAMPARNGAKQQIQRPHQTPHGSHACHKGGQVQPDECENEFAELSRFIEDSLLDGTDEGADDYIDGKPERWREYSGNLAARTVVSSPSEKTDTERWKSLTGLRVDATPFTPTPMPIVAM